MSSKLCNTSTKLELVITKDPWEHPGVFSVYVDQSRELFHDRGNNLGESLRITDREVSQHLPIKDDIAGAH